MNDYKSNKTLILEQSLINFLLNKNDVIEKIGLGRRRILSLQLKIKAENPKHLIFTVQMGMFIAEFNLLNGIKERGACYGLERYIRDWAERDSVKSEMMELASTKSGSSSSDNRGSNIRNTLR